MAALGAIGVIGDGGTYLKTTATRASRATAVAPTTRPSPQGGIIFISTTGGIRG